MSDQPFSDRVKVRSHPERAHYDHETACEILDAGRHGHLTTILDNDIRCVPMMYVRYGNSIHIHGRAHTPLMEHLLRKTRLCFAVTLIDGLVLARSVRYNAVNYRSIVLYGEATEVTDVRKKIESFEKLGARNWPGPRKLTPPTRKQLDSVNLLEVPLAEFSIKIRTGPPLGHLPDDDPALWSGHVDLKTIPSACHPDATTDSSVALSEWTSGW
ncbi:MAG: pyridoxamine 5'-phosphate oxidase family protein [Burkholderiaceae bacterium]